MPNPHPPLHADDEPVSARGVPTWLRRFAPWLGALGGVLLITSDGAIAVYFGYVFDFSHPAGLGLAVVVFGSYMFLGAALGFLWRLRDDLKRSQSQLLRSEKLATLGQFAASVAHEVRNPLSVIKASSALIGEALPPHSEEKKAADFITLEVDRLNGFVTGLLSLAHERPPRQDTVDLESLVNEAALLCQPLIDKRQQKFVFKNRAPTLARGDADLLSRVIYGLLLNAVQATPPRGDLLIELRRRPGEVGCLIHDSGPGVPAPDRERIFDPFFTTKASGTGLGLAIAHRIIDAHGGTLTLDVTEPTGAAFHFWVPSVEETAP